MFAHIQNNTVIEYPVKDIRARFPNTSLPEILNSETLPDGYVIVSEVTPDYDPSTQTIERATPVLTDGQWVMTYTVIQRTDVTEIHKEAIKARLRELDAKRIRPLAEGDTAYLQSLNSEVIALRSQLASL